MNSSIPQQIMNTNGDQSQLLKQLVMNHAANINNQQQQTNVPTTTTMNNQQGAPVTMSQQGIPSVLPATSSNSMYDLSQSLNSSQLNSSQLSNSQQLNNSQNLNNSIPNTFQSPAQIPTSSVRQQSSPQTLPDFNNVVSSLLNDAEENQPAQVTSASSLQQQLQQQEQMKIRLQQQELMKMQMQNQQAVNNLMQNSQENASRLEALNQQQMFQQQQPQQQQPPQKVKWFYRDPQGQIQGEFSSDQMLDWFSSGYFPNDLELRIEIGTNVHLVTLGHLMELNNGQVPFKLTSNQLQLPQQRPQQQQPVANGSLPEQKVQQFKMLMGQKLQGMKNERDAVINNLARQQDVKLDDYKQRLLASPQTEEKFRGRSNQEITAYFQVQLNQYVAQLKMELENVTQSLNTAILNEQKMAQIKLSQFIAQHQIPVTSQQELNNSQQQLNTSAQQELQNNQQSNMNQMQSAAQQMNSTMNSSMNSVNNTSMNTSANISATMNNNTQAGMPTANAAGMNNGTTTTSSVWHDPAIIRQMEGAPSQNMMELLRERTEQQIKRENEQKERQRLLEMEAAKQQEQDNLEKQRQAEEARRKLFEQQENEG